MAAPKTVVDLVERFQRNIESYKKGGYNETQVRREFIDPFFEALGWDVNNTQGYAEAYKDVIHEDSIRVGSATKAPDYCFRIGGTRKFFLEAKKPSIDIKGDPSPAFQLRRYAWSGKLPLSILTDFEELAVYDCRIRPVKTDKSSKGRILYFTYEDYIEKWDEIAAIFSREAVLKGSFDKFAETSKSKRGTAEVDTSFLAEIEEWRDTLARNIALRNPALDHRELNFAVQRTIDRIIFLRICEDRGVERYGELMALLNGEKVYDRLLGLYRRADDRYNSGLFHFSKETGRHDPPDELTPNLTIDDKTLKDIFRRLYYPDCPFEFSVLPAEILGQVYEQFLGSTISLTAGHRAKVEHKPEVKKAGGVFYTPAYIVDYIVKNTVGKLLEGKTPRQVSKIKTLDPACGSGSFLLGAYQFLLDWHLQYYLDNEPKKWAKKKNPPICSVAEASCFGKGSSGILPESEDIASKTQPRKSRKNSATLGNYKLTLSERKRILLDNLYGVDIDSQAVEVTKLSLLLKVLEGEKQLVLFHTERALPDLSENIKCGNSLIGSDFYTDQQMDLFDDELNYKINAFDWEKEFAGIFKDKNPGFDAVIGNPPYGASLDDLSKRYLDANYITAEYQYDTYSIFVEKGLALLKKSGLWSMIIPNTWSLNVRCPKTRNYILNHKIVGVRHFLKKVFPKVTVDTEIWILENFKSDKAHKVTVEIVDKNNTEIFSVLQCTWQSSEDAIFNVRLNPVRYCVWEKIQKKNALLEELFKVTQGCKPFQKGKGSPPQTAEILEKKPYVSDTEQDNSWSKLLAGKLMHRYTIKWNRNYWIKFGEWLAEPRHSASYNVPEKIVIRQTGDSLVATLDTEQYIVRDNLYTIIPKDELTCKYLLGLLNSNLFEFLYSCVNPEKGEALAQVKATHIKSLPVRDIDFSNKAEKELHNKVVSLVELMLGLHKKLAAARTGDATVRLERQIAATDEQIDSLVYELYNLTDEEIAIIEEN